MPKDDVKILVCPVCDKHIEKGEKKYMVALERPYMNLYFHSDCYETLDNLGDFIVDYLKLQTITH